MKDQIVICCPYWGMKHLTYPEFAKLAHSQGFQGVEVAIDPLLQNVCEVKKYFDDYDLKLIVQLPYAAGLTAEIMRGQFLRMIEECLQHDLFWLNCHTGRDYFTFDENLLFLTESQNLIRGSSTCLSHEIHRGRFSYDPMRILAYLQESPDSMLTADFSHWCVVTESMLENHQEVMKRVYGRCSHIHARIGHEQGAQLVDPFHMKNEAYLTTFQSWWQEIIRVGYNSDSTKILPITCEFGPRPYLLEPYDIDVTAEQWKQNGMMKDFILKNFG